MQRYVRWMRRPVTNRQRAALLGLAALVFLWLLPAGLLTAGKAIDRRTGWRFPLPAFLRKAVGALLIGTGAPLAVWAVAEEVGHGQGTPVPMAPTQRLLTGGPFRYTRNPMSLGMLSALVGLGWLANSPGTVMVVKMMGSALMAYNFRREESELELRFGPEYERYRLRTPFFFPWKFG